MSFFLAIKRSAIAFAVTLAVGLLSMGALGAALYYACYLVFSPFYGDLNEWRGDWVWNATIWAGMLWSISFLVAGWFNLQLERRASAPTLRHAVYAGVLWLGAALIWALLLMTSFEPA